MTPAQATDRRAEIDAELRASGKAWQYSERQPERDHFRLWHNWRDERTAIGLVAHHGTMATHARFNALHGQHEPRCWWCYEPPPGVEIRTDEPDEWSGWRPVDEQPQEPATGRRGVKS